jgi:hypothetical protein
MTGDNLLGFPNSQRPLQSRATLWADELDQVR